MDRVSKIPYHGRTARDTVGSDDLPLALNIILRRIRAVGGHSETAESGLHAPDLLFREGDRGGCHARRGDLKVRIRLTAAEPDFAGEEVVDGLRHVVVGLFDETTGEPRGQRREHEPPAAKARYRSGRAGIRR